MLMLLERREYVVEHGATPPLDIVTAALTSDFDLLREPPCTVRRTWLDTFDWRLFRAGLTLESLADDERNELSLATLAGRQLARSPADGAAWPGRLNGAGLGTLGAQLAPVVGVRALLPMARTVGTRAGLRLLNSDEKTVVRAVVDQSEVLTPAPGSLAARVTLTPLRGYERQALLAHRALIATVGIVPSGWSQLDMALAPVGRRPGDYNGKIEIHLTASTTASSAMADVLLHVLDLLEANVDGVARDLDSEFLHDLRIAVRRTRSGLKLAGDALPDGLAARFGAEFRWLGQLTTPVRDLDACLEGLDETLVDLGSDDHDALEPFRRYLDQRRNIARPDLVAGLGSPRFADLISTWRAELDAVRGRCVEGELTVAGLAAARILRGYNRILTAGKAITPTSPAEDLHDLRKRCKQLRYLLEYFASLHPPAAHRAIIKELKSVQECLGRFQDSEFQRAAITSLTEQMARELTVPAATLRAMEQLSAKLDRQQREARNEFASRFDRFVSARTSRLMTALTEPAS